MYETDKWPFTQARDYIKWAGPPPRRPVQCGVIHCAITAEQGDTAESLAKYATHPDYPSSWHIAVDSNSITQSVHDNDVAYGAKGFNRAGIHIELAGKIEQTREQWLDPYGIAMLALAADAAAQYSLKYDLPATHLTNDQLRAGMKGWVGHVQITQVFKLSNHVDPGPNFPWDYFMAHMAAFYNVRKTRMTI